MGHDIRTHREYYRLSEGTLEVAKVSKILHQLNMGKITQTDAAQLHGNQTIIDEETTVSDEEASSDEDVEESDDQHDEENRGGVPLSSSKPAVSGFQPQYGYQGEGYDTDYNDDDMGDPDWIYNKRKHAPDSEDSDEDLKRQRKKNRNNSGKKKWTPQEQRVVMSEFEKYMHLNKCPGKSEREKLLKENPCLSRRSWRNIKDFVRNKTKTFIKHQEN
ncbi:uncharacterized protein LOC127857972 [Dreissena polymorpha]|nr:uncharacterized protein LOC127857972 [Dreissena polymorpha]